MQIMQAAIETTNFRFIPAALRRATVCRLSDKAVWKHRRFETRQRLLCLCTALDTIPRGSIRFIINTLYAAFLLLSSGKQQKMPGAHKFSR